MPKQNTPRKQSATKEPYGQKQTAGAIRPREYKAASKKTPVLAESPSSKKKRLKKRNADKTALGRARKKVETQDGFQELSKEEQQKLLADAEAGVRQKRGMDDAALPASREEQHTRLSTILEDQQHETLSADTTGTTPESRSSLEQDQGFRTASSPEVDLRTSQARLLDQQPEQNAQPTSGHEGQQRTAPTAGITGTTRESNLSLEQGQSGQFTFKLEQDQSDQSTSSLDADQRTAQPLVMRQQQHQQHPPKCRYSNQFVLGLVIIKNTLSDSVATEASLLIALTQGGHHRSGDDVEDLQGLYAPRRARLEGLEAVHEQQRIAFDEAKSNALKYEAFLVNLDVGLAERAQRLLAMYKNSPEDRPYFQERLDDIFSLMAQVNIQHLTATSSYSHIFREIDDAVNRNRTDAAQPT